MSHSVKTLRRLYEPGYTGSAAVYGKPGAAGSTSVVNSHDLKLHVWYDNDFGYARRRLDIIPMPAS